MHRSSESVGAIATALAKAQLEIINPEKSLVGVIRPLVHESWGEPSAMLPYQAVWRSRARASAGRRLRSCSQPRSTKNRV